MRAGRRNKKIQIRGFVQAKDEFGQPVKTPFTVATVWASINPLTGRETWIAEKYSAELDTKIEIRWRTDIREDYHIKHGKSFYKIEYIVNPEMANRDLIIACKKVGDQDINA